MSKLGFIGSGNMGFAMLKGASQRFGSENLTYTDVSTERLEYIKEQLGIDFIRSNKEIMNQCNYVVLSVKPQYYQSVLNDIKANTTKEHIMISIAPGITIDDVKMELGSDVKVVRAMPNTPALVNEGMSGICFSEDNFSEEETKFVCDFFDSFGKYEIVEERLMNAIVCASGSSPAYVYMLIEALADGAVKYGVPRDKAYRLVAQTVLGSAKMVLETNEHPGKLKDQVCSPGGTTIAAVAALEEYGFRNSLIKATDKCYEKCTSVKR